MKMKLKPKVHNMFWSKFGNSSWNRWQVIVRTNPKWGKIWLSSYIWPWRWRSITAPAPSPPQKKKKINKRDLNQGVLHLWSKFGYPSLNGWWVIIPTSKWLIHTHTHTHTGRDTQTQAMTIPEGQNWPRVKNCLWNRSHGHHGEPRWQWPGRGLCHLMVDSPYNRQPSFH